MIVSTLIEAGPVEIEIEADVRLGVPSSEFDPGDGPEIQWIKSYRLEKGRRVDVPVASVEQVLGVEAWQAVEEQLYSAAEWSDEGPDPDAERDQEMDR